MSLSCGTTCIKYLLFLFNLIFVITGVVLISIGISVKDYYLNYETFVERRYLYAPEFLTGTGILIFIIAFFGCCGAIKENPCLTLTFSSLLLLIFFLEIAGGIGGYLLKNTTQDYLSHKLSATMLDYKVYQDVTIAWDTVQKDFKCCGVHGPADWFNVTSTNYSIPNSCCDPLPGAVGGYLCNINATTLHSVGCLRSFGDFLTGHAHTIEAAGLGIGFVQLVGIILSCYLTSQMRKGYQTV